MVIDNNESVINLEGISFGYPGHSLILNNLDLKLFKGGKIGLLGPNGSGKTTLFHIIMGLLQPLSGTIDIFGKPVRQVNDFKKNYRKIGLLFQDSDDQLFCPTVLEDVAFGPLNLDQPKDEAIRTAKETLNYIGLSGFEDRITHKLSGGEKRLVALATVLAMKPEVLLLDEPSTGLDDKTKAKITDVLNNLKLSCIIISHETNFVAGVTNSMCKMENGKIFKYKKPHMHVHTHPHILHTG